MTPRHLVRELFWLVVLLLFLVAASVVVHSDKIGLITR